MAGRPMVRKEYVAEGTVHALRAVFGSAVNAYRNLRIVDAVSYPIFLRVWGRKGVSLEVCARVEEAWEAWKARVGELGGSGEEIREALDRAG